jgi:hypothetical protein
VRKSRLGFFRLLPARQLPVPKQQIYASSVRYKRRRTEVPPWFTNSRVELKQKIDPNDNFPLVDVTRVHQSINVIEAGLITVNLPTAGVEYQLPFGGTKESSYGMREQGPQASTFTANCARST